MCYMFPEILGKFRTLVSLEPKSTSLLREVPILLRGSILGKLRTLVSSEPKLISFP